MNRSESIAKLSASLVKAQNELKSAPRTSVNPHYRSKYADLATCMDTIRPTLHKYGLAVMQFPGSAGEDVVVETVLVHESGEWVSCAASAKPANMLPQSVGSAVTYLRRYGLAITGLVTDDDDDGNGAGKPENGHKGNGAHTPSNTTPAPASQPQAPINCTQRTNTFTETEKGPYNGKGAITDPQRKRMYAIAKEHAWSDAGFADKLKELGYASSKAVTKDKYNEVCAVFEMFPLMGDEPPIDDSENTLPF